MNLSNKPIYQKSIIKADKYTVFNDISVGFYSVLYDFKNYIKPLFIFSRVF